MAKSLFVGTGRQIRKDKGSYLYTVLNCTAEEEQAIGIWGQRRFSIILKQVP